MTAKLKIYRGLPGSGKTSKALAEAERGDSREGHVLVGRDHIRRQFGIQGGVGTPEEESRVTQEQEVWIKEGLDCFDHAVIHIDDMNLKGAYVKRFLRIAQNLRADVEVVDLRDTPLQTCIDNDLKRKAEGGHYVGEARIRDLHRRYITKQSSGMTKMVKRKGMPDSYKPALYTPDISLPVGFIVDLDGTTAIKHSGRSFHDYNDKVLDDIPNRPVIDVVKGLMTLGRKPVFLSGRMDSCEFATRSWISRYITASNYPLLMRKTGDTRPDYEVKDELFENHVKHEFAINLALDDRNQIVDLWRAKGIPTLQVQDGNF
jgi:hypothetical protein